MSGLSGRQNRSSSEGIMYLPPPRFYRPYRSITPYMHDCDFAPVGLILISCKTVHEEVILKDSLQSSIVVREDNL